MTYRVDYKQAREELQAAIDHRKPARLWLDRKSGRIVGRQTDVAHASGIRDQDLQSLRKAFQNIRCYDSIMVDVQDVLQAYSIRIAQSQLTESEAE